MLQQQNRVRFNAVAGRRFYSAVGFHEDAKVATQNIELLTTLAAFVAIVVGATIFHGVVILPLLLYIFTKKTVITPISFS